MYVLLAEGIAPGVERRPGRGLALDSVRAVDHSGATAPGLHRLPARDQCGTCGAIVRPRQRRDVPLATRLTLLCCAATSSARAGGFASPSEPPDEAGLRKARAFRLQGRSPGSAIVAPSAAARDIAAALGLAATADDALRDMGWGAWTGLSFEAVHATAAAALAAWLADPASGTPGGETFAALASRVDDWLRRIVDAPDSVVAVTHPMVVRAALSVTIGAAADVAMRIDLPPLATVELSHDRVWRLRELRRA